MVDFSVKIVDVIFEVEKKEESVFEVVLVLFFVLVLMVEELKVEEVKVEVFECKLLL